MGSYKLTQEVGTEEKEAMEAVDTEVSLEGMVWMQVDTVLEQVEALVAKEEMAVTEQAELVAAKEGLSRS